MTIDNKKTHPYSFEKMDIYFSDRTKYVGCKLVSFDRHGFIEFWYDGEFFTANRKHIKYCKYYNTN